MTRKDVILEILERYRQLGRYLNEFQRRHWAATEALKIGRGGITIVSIALRISPNTIKRGIQEIAAGQSDLHPEVVARIRKPGGGRKPKKSNPSSGEPKIEARHTNSRESGGELRPANCAPGHAPGKPPLPVNLDAPQGDDAVANLTRIHPESQ